MELASADTSLSQKSRMIVLNSPKRATLHVVMLGASFQLFQKISVETFAALLSSLFCFPIGSAYEPKVRYLVTVLSTKGNFLSMFLGQPSLRVHLGRYSLSAVQ